MSIIKKIGFLSAFTLVAIYVVIYPLGSYWYYSMLLFVFIIIPVFDMIVGKDPNNIEKSAIKNISAKIYYRLVLYTWTYVQLGIVVFGAYAVTFGQINTTTEWILFLINTSLITGGIGITVAHELGHKKSKLERFYSKALLMTVCYMHFYIEHNQGHHVHVATPNDPATARKNENFYQFWFRSVFRGYASAWSIEKRSLEHKGFDVISLKNRMIVFALLPILFCTVLTILFSFLANDFTWQIPLYFFGQSLLAFTLLELVNYVEHYGIVRRKKANNTYERVTHLHSWNANFLLSNFFLFQLQRHSDHHMNAIRRYQALMHYDDSPQLPFGYPTMIILALFPTFWFRYMNPKLENWKRVYYTTSTITP